MQRIRILGLALMAVLAFSALASATASAELPEFEAPFPNTFTGKQEGVGKLETKAKRTVECSGGSSEGGSITAAKTVTIKAIIFTGCKSTTFGAGKCQNTATEGEIKTTELSGEPVYISKAKKEVAQNLKPTSAALFAEFKCKTLLGEETLKVRPSGANGGVICGTTPVNTKTTKLKLECKEKGGVQEPTELENGKGEKFKSFLETEGKGPENFAFEQSGNNSTSAITTIKETTLKA
jgi:hypothetical protein